MLYALNETKLFTPGSTTKLVTEGTAMGVLGADYRFTTRVYRTGPVSAGALKGDLVLVASGDPNISNRLKPDGTLAFENEDHSYDADPSTRAVPGDPLQVLKDLAKKVKAAGIKSVSGSVIVDASLFPEGDRELGTGVVISPMGSSYPRLFLSAGVTTIRTTGSVDAYQELNLKRLSDSLKIVAPTIVVTGPYLQGAGSGFVTMPALSGPESARRMVRYWAEEGVTWFKAYTQISRAELGAAIDEAHKHGVKVTAHLCSVGFREAVALGIDALEHGMLTNTEWYAGKKPDQCPQASTGEMYGALDINSPEVQQTIQDMPYRVHAASEKPPRLFGQEFKRYDQYNYWGLHVWAWRRNAAGLFADWNPAITC